MNKIKIIKEKKMKCILTKFVKVIKNTIVFKFYYSDYFLY